jgi:hypothetical protein
MRNYGGNVRGQVFEEGLAVKKNQWAWIGIVALGMAMAAVQPVGAQTPAPNVPQDMASPPAPAAASTPYQPKFAGDPARSDSEAQALGYMRVVLRAQREYKKRHDKFAESLPALAGTGSLTKRMARSNERGDYTVSFKSQKDGFILTMTPKQVDSEHRSFYAEEDGIIHADDQKAADQNSPKIK